MARARLFIPEQFLDNNKIKSQLDVLHLLGLLNQLTGSLEGSSTGWVHDNAAF